MWIRRNRIQIRNVCLALGSALIFPVAGCDVLPLAGRDVSVGQATDSEPPGAQSVVEPEPCSAPRESGSAGVGANVEPVASIEIVGSDRSEILVDDTSLLPVVLDGSASCDPDGTVVSYRWYINSNLIGAGATLSIGELPIGVSTVVLEVTDDQDAMSSNEIRIIRTGLRAGEWLGVTGQGYEISFRVSSESVVSDLVFGFEFDGQNLLNGTPCRFVSNRTQCSGCIESSGSQGFTFQWGELDTFIVDGECSAPVLSDPPCEFVRGVLSAIPSSNCAGSVDGIAWEARWESE